MDGKLEIEIKKLVSRIARVHLSKVDIKADLFRDLGLDSLKGIEIIAAVERKYKVRFKRSMLGKVRNIGNMIELIRDAKKQ